MEKNLVRLNHNAPDFQKLSAMNRWLDNMLRIDADTSNKEWIEGIREIMFFQDQDASFNLLDSFHIDSDACFEFCVLPHHKATAVLMRAFLEDKSIFFGKNETLFESALRKCCDLGLAGNGYESLEGLLTSLKIFLQGNVREFLRRYPDYCPEFTNMITECFADIIHRGEKQAYRDEWGGNHEKDIREIINKMQNESVFVYGTLLDGQPNHNAYLAGKTGIYKGTVSGYDMHDLGSFPGIVRSAGKVKGEIYDVTDDELKKLDFLEGEGVLYIRKPVMVTLDSGEKKSALAYIYNRGVENCVRIPFEAQPYRSGRSYPKATTPDQSSDLVWYVSYGSNMLEERFLSYLLGGTCRYNGRHYTGCTNKSPYVRSKAVMIPYSMYYANTSGSWSNSAVSFLDVSRNGRAYGRAWLIRRDQLHEIHIQEGAGKEWYPDAVELDPIEGIPAFTFSNRRGRMPMNISKVSSAYLTVLRNGLSETYPELSAAEIDEYPRCCGCK